MSIQSSMSPCSFWQSLDILITKFNVINKRLWGCKILFRSNCKPINTSWNMPADCTKLGEEENIDLYRELILQELNLVQHFETHTTNDCIELIIIEYLPKSYNQRKAYQLILLQRTFLTATFYDITPKNYTQTLCPDFKYSFTLQNGTILLDVDDDCQSKSYQWLKYTILPQIVKWGEEDSNKNRLCKDSLALISTEKYYMKYNELKLKYGKEMVEVWPEQTDPSKFVYEDVAIATYLVLLWEEENPQRKTFVDLGCGNGLLVYILTKEGHQGIGIDVRKRQIWDMYPADVKLEVKTIVPSDVNLFPNADWLIGNHSDELTPWLPVIAARSSYTCRFFLLPCCAYNFDGTKYQRKDSSKSQYTEYLEYIKGLSECCGFDTKIDRLKIPSTKRICFVGQKRIYKEENFQLYCDKINSLITGDLISTDVTTNSTLWASNFKPRGSIEKVRNCTQIAKSVIESIVFCITKYLLEGCNLQTEWSCGKLVDLSKLVALLTEDQLKAMKAECGGLQTLLRNNHHIFIVQNGKVQLRYPKTIDEVNNRSIKNYKNKNSITKVKLKPCWFHIHHPQGCPLADNVCSYLH